MRITTALLSVPRPEGYVHTTIRSIEESGAGAVPNEAPLRLVCGSPDSSHLEQYRHRPDRFIVEDMNADEARTLGIAHLGPRRKCALGHYRAMTLSRIATQEWDAALICEDDIVFARGWRRYLDSVIQEVRACSTSKWIITLYRIKHPHQAGTSPHVEAGKTWFKLDPAEEFWGTQAIVYSKDALDVIPEDIHRKAIAPFIMPIDIAIGKAAAEHGIPVYATAPSLVQHIGERSTGQAKWFHEAECFRESLE